jgi:phenylalanyl-tRNA synthetase beta chain
MKLSLAWIFDHIDASLPSQNLNELFIRFNEASAEIDGIHKLSYDLENMFVATVSEIKSSGIELHIAELSKKVLLPFRDDVQDNSQKNASYVYLIKKTDTTFEWTTHIDFGQERTTPTPLMNLDSKYHNGSWRDFVGKTDTHIEVDNKTITHRPDMWGHRGFAREIAAFMNLPLKKTESLIKDLTTLKTTDSASFTVNVESKGCKRFMLAHISQIDNKPSDFKMAFQLMRIGMRAFNALIDMTNFVMLDWSQPSHAFDAASIDQKTLIVRNAKPNEEIILLDGTTHALDASDMVVGSPLKILSLAGIKGGLNSGVSPKTTSLAVEFATWDASTIRKTALKVNQRTDAAARYEKTLSTEQLPEAMGRLLYVAEKIGINPIITEPIIDIRTIPYEQKTITLSHDFIENRLGIAIEDEKVVSILKSLQFEVGQSIDQSGISYAIKIPHWRASKDVAIPEDIIEEIARMYGFNKIALTLPAKTCAPENMSIVSHERNLKRILSGIGEMVEQKNYMYFDAAFTNKIHLKTAECLEILNPVSSQQSLLVHTLIPGLLKNVEDNINEFDTLSFFEINATWKAIKNAPHKEEQRLSGIFFSRRTTVNFYNKKSLLNKILAEAGLSDAQWRASEFAPAEWLEAESCAMIWHKGIEIGTAGFLKKDFLNKLTGTLPESSAIIFDFDYRALKYNKKCIVKFKQLSRYQSSSLDISMLIPKEITYEFVEKNLQQIHEDITEIQLIDSFTKKEWGGKRSLTFRLKISNNSRTTTKEDLDIISKKIVSFAKLNALEIRE